jgi:hypothetical protein
MRWAAPQRRRPCAIVYRVWAEKKGRISKRDMHRSVTINVPNGINLSRRLLASQALAEYFSWLRHSVVFFGATFDDARFIAVGSFGVHLEVAQLRTGPGCSQSAERVGKADAFHGNLLAPRRFHHDGAHHVVDQGEHGQLFENALHGFTTQYVHFHRLF